MKKFRGDGAASVFSVAEDARAAAESQPLQSSFAAGEASILMKPKARRVPSLVEDEKEEDSIAVDPPAPSTVTLQQLRQPTIMLHRPTPVRVTEEFYEQVESLPFMEVQAALRASHEWHVKYTGNQANPMPYVATEDTTSASASTMLWLDREGAKNPSPCHSSNTEGHQQQPKAKRLRDSFPPEGAMEESKDRDGDSMEEQHGLGAVIVAPRAIQRPVAIRVTAILHRIPRHICENAQNQRPSSLSPISLGSSCSSASSPSLLGRTLEIPTHHPAVIECEDHRHHHQEHVRQGVHRHINTASQIQQARDGLLHALAISGGETNSDAFRNCLNILQEHYTSEIMYATGTNSSSTRTTSSTLAAQQAEGMWLTLTKPNFFDCLGDNDRGDPMYTLARMSFNMFSPANLICSLQGNFNSVELVVNDDQQQRTMAVPKSLSDAVLGSGSQVELRTYNIITAFTIEPPMAAYPNAPNQDVTRRIRGTMTTYGYMIPDPDHPTRDSVWITGGKIEPHAADKEAWLALFRKHPPVNHSLAAQAQLLAVKWLMGAVLPEGMNPETGVMEYSFSRPIGGHGFAYIDTLYNDDSLRVVRGHRGTYFVFSRMPSAAL